MRRRAGSPLRLHSLDDGANELVDGLGAPDGFLGLLILAINGVVLSGPEALPGHLIDDVDVDDHLELPLDVGRRAGAGLVADRDVGLIAPDGPTYDCVGALLGAGAQPELPDEADAEQLYSILEQQVVPTFHDRQAWVGMMKSSIAALAPRFSMQRTVIEYAERYYVPVVKTGHA